jgi:hypothetical protein
MRGDEIMPDESDHDQQMPILTTKVQVILIQHGLVEAKSTLGPIGLWHGLFKVSFSVPRTYTLEGTVAQRPSFMTLFVSSNNFHFVSPS